MLILLVLAALLGGCGGSDGGLADAMIGAWQTGVYGNTVEFRDDGTYDVVEAFTDPLRELEWGTWSTEDDVLTMVPAEDAPYCPGLSGSYTIEILEDGDLLDPTVEDDTCSGRRTDFGSELRRSTDTGP
jgi:hypothetical protein